MRQRPKPVITRWELTCTNCGNLLASWNQEAEPAPDEMPDVDCVWCDEAENAERN